ncbi:MAG: amidohydrolase [Prevotellaceae bacterium]|nr:amidohydrolase [Candidatus Minthosoma equi]
MKISLLQQDIIWANPSANQQVAEGVLRDLEKSDVYVLPEMFSTGFAVHPEDVAEKDGLSLRWMQMIAAKLDAAICGSVAIEEDGKFANRFYFVKPDGECIYYDKRHLFTYGGEHKRYTKGEERVVVDFRGVRFLLQVCYDLRFPVFARNNDETPYDVAIYVASWPTSRIEVWNTLLHARAIENQCYVAAVNRVGEDLACKYCGGTMLIDAYGRTIAECELNKQCAITADLDMEALAAFRKKFPVLDDAD